MGIDCGRRGWPYASGDARGNCTMVREPRAASIVEALNARAVGGSRAVAVVDVNTRVGYLKPPEGFGWALDGFRMKICNPR